MLSPHGVPLDLLDRMLIIRCVRACLVVLCVESVVFVERKGGKEENRLVWWWRGLWGGGEGCGDSG